MAMAIEAPHARLVSLLVSSLRHHLRKQRRRARQLGSISELKEGGELVGVVARSPAMTTMDAAEASPLEVSPRAGGSWRRSRPWSRTSSSIGRSGSSSCGSGSIEYTSLRDVLEEECGGGGGDHQHQHSPWRGGGGGSGSGWGEYSCHDIHDFDASNIGIRNQLLKHAASAYLQSAVVVVAAAPGHGDDGEERCCCCCRCLARLWRRAGRGGGRGRVLMRAWGSMQLGCADDPAELCAAFVARSARRVAAFVAGRANAVWAWRV